MELPGGAWSPGRFAIIPPMLFPFPLFPAPLAPAGSLWGWVRLAPDSVSQLLSCGALSSVQFSVANGTEVSQGSQLPPYSPGNSHMRLSAPRMSLSRQEEEPSTRARCQPGRRVAWKMRAISASLWLTSCSKGTALAKQRAAQETSQRAQEHLRGPGRTSRGPVGWEGRTGNFTQSTASSSLSP